MLAAAIGVGGDPIVHPGDFRVTTFASGINDPHGLQAFSDGSLLVADISSSGELFSPTGLADGKIYQIKAIPPVRVALTAPIGGRFASARTTQGAMFVGVQGLAKNEASTPIPGTVLLGAQGSTQPVKARSVTVRVAHVQKKALLLGVPIKSRDRLPRQTPKVSDLSGS